MPTEVVTALVTDRDGFYVDGTVGDGGHARVILDATAPRGRLLGLDRDAGAIRAVRMRLAEYGGRLQLIQEDFRNLGGLLARLGRTKVAGVLLDLGLRSSALDDPERGFAHRLDGPLDMRFDPSHGRSAADLLAEISFADLVRLLAEGTTRADPRRIARGLLAFRERGELRRTSELTRCLRTTLGRRATPKLLGSVFATIRMAVNGELEALEQALECVPAALTTGGVLCVLSYQSQEDRRVKQLQKRLHHDPVSGETFRLEPLWRRPQRPSPDEGRRNPRARSARLRALRRTAPQPPS
jgi:16S rRNA (cytosine1402-N4)-methyltransferase